MEATYPYAIKNQRIQEMPLVGGFGCLELVLYGIRELAEQHYDLNQPEHSVWIIWTNDILLTWRHSERQEC